MCLSGHKWTIKCGDIDEADCVCLVQSSSRETRPQMATVHWTCTWRWLADCWHVFPCCNTLPHSAHTHTHTALGTSDLHTHMQSVSVDANPARLGEEVCGGEVVFSVTGKSVLNGNAENKWNGKRHLTCFIESSKWFTRTNYIKHHSEYCVESSRVLSFHRLQQLHFIAVLTVIILEEKKKKRCRSFKIFLKTKKKISCYPFTEM